MIPRRPHLAAAALILAQICLAGSALGSGTQHKTAHYDSAVRLIQKGDLRGGIIELKNALQADPNDIAARVLLGRSYLRLNQGAAAAKELLRARQDGADDRFVLPLLGQAYLSLGQFDKVLKEIRPTGQEKETAAAIAVIRGHAYLALNRLDQAEKNYRSALAVRHDDPRPYTGLARIFIARGNLDEAERQAAAALKVSPNWADGWYVQGVVERLRGHAKAAITAYDRALKIYPRHEEALLDRAQVLLDTGRYKDADRDILKIRGFDRRNVRALYLHAVALTKLGDRKKADDALLEAEQILRQLPADALRSNPQTMLLFGTISYYRKNYDEAFDHLSAFLERAPHHAGARKMLATIALHRGRPGQAVDFLAPLATRQQEDVDYLILYCDALIRAGRRSSVSDLLDRATRLAKPGSSAMSRILSLRLAAGDNEEAIELLKDEIARHPGADGTAVTLATTQMRQRDFEAALATVTPILARHPDSPALHTLAGGAYLGLGKSNAARQSFDAALRLDPDYAPALVSFGRMEMTIGNMSGARQRFLRLLDKDPGNGNAMSYLAEIERRGGNIKGAIGWLEKARTSSRDKDKAAHKLIDLYIVTKRADDAVKLAEAMHLKAPTDLGYLAALGRAQFAAGKTEQATGLFRQLARDAAQAKSTDWLFRASQLLSRVGDRENVRAALEAAEKIDGNLIPVQVALFNLDLASGKTGNARVRADRVAKLAPKASIGDILHGRLSMWTRHYDDAARAYGVAFGKAPSTALAAELYNARRQAGQNSLPLVEDWARKNPNDRDAQQLLAGAYTIARRNDEAIGLYERLLKTDPNSVEFFNNLAILYQRKGDRRALDFARRALALNPSHGGLMDTYGWILVQNGKAAEGLRLLRNARTRLPNVAEIRYHFAVALNALGRTSEARQELRGALDDGQPFEGIEDARALMKKLSSAR